jgi:hypothetical protein
MYPATLRTVATRSRSRNIPDTASRYSSPARAFSLNLMKYYILATDDQPERGPFETIADAFQATRPGDKIVPRPSQPGVNYRTQ